MQALCSRDSNLLTARAQLKLLFRQLEAQKNPLSRKFVRSLKRRIDERWTINAGVFYYLHNCRLNDDDDEQAIGSFSFYVL